MAIYVVGLRQLRRQLTEAADDFADLKDANRRSAEIVADEASRRAPVASGKLRSDIRISATKKTGIVRAGRKAIPYAAPIHWGWPARGIRPNLFASKAAKATEPEWVAEYERRMNEIIDKIKGANE